MSPKFKQLLDSIIQAARQETTHSHGHIRCQKSFYQAGFQF
jgi:hypothetical protein